MCASRVCRAAPPAAPGGASALRVEFLLSLIPGHIYMLASFAAGAGSAPLQPLVCRYVRSRIPAHTSSGREPTYTHQLNRATFFKGNTGTLLNIAALAIPIHAAPGPPHFKLPEYCNSLTRSATLLAFGNDALEDFKSSISTSSWSPGTPFTARLLAGIDNFLTFDAKTPQILVLMLKKTRQESADIDRDGGHTVTSGVLHLDSKVD
ncbi:hypothetical protein C8F04DRAFT_1177508 [Mycena alexandri]|uniref:Uncharacterized protein n=1 Tax=Mycena alexandri TaxID=1745969 RepID=A0AAD6T7L2_9AGAR|nr:hypothetical protein C8F04DRAFT_1177508 [Mycena alexandri]